MAKDLPWSLTCGDKWTGLLAGLGDVVLPGLLACLALRFDAVRLLQPGQTAGTDSSDQVNLSRCRATQSCSI